MYRKVGRPRNKIMKLGSYVSFTFEQLQTLERAAWFLTAIHDKHNNRNDAIRFAIDYLLKPKVAESENELKEYEKTLNGQSITQIGYREFHAKNKEVKA